MNFKKTNLFILIGLLSSALIYSCDKNQETQPKVSTLEPITTTFNSATCKGIVLSDGDATIQERGVCYSKTSTPTINDNKAVDSSTEKDTFSVKLEDLDANTLYYARAYATNSEGTSYGQEITFTLWLNYPDELVQDIDNNTYSTIRIGNQVWMKDNLKVSHYRNGDPIANIPLQSDSQWLSNISGAYCYYDDDITNAEKYGFFYNGYAVVDARGICPDGWHVPSKEEWKVLIEYLGGTFTAGNLLKGSSGWESLNPHTTNLSGYNALPSGFRVHFLPERTYTLYDGIKQRSLFWTKDEYNSIYVSNGMWYISLQGETEWALINDNIIKTCGLNIRCIKN